MSDAPSSEPVIEPVSGQAEFLARAAELVRGAALQVSIFSQNLERRTYGVDDFIAPLTKFLLAHERARLRIIVRSPGQTMLGGHRLVELGRQLSSRIEFHELPPEKRLIEREFLLADQRALLIRESPQELIARYYPDSPHHAQAQWREFELLWQESTPSAEMRRLGI
jgi:hypothetical protein